MAGLKSYQGGPKNFGGAARDDERGTVWRGGLVAAGDNCDCRECDSTDPHCVPRELQLFPALTQYRAEPNDRAEVITARRPASWHPCGRPAIK